MDGGPLRPAARGSRRVCRGGRASRWDRAVGSHGALGGRRAIVCGAKTIVTPIRRFKRTHTWMKPPLAQSAVRIVCSGPRPRIGSGARPLEPTSSRERDEAAFRAGALQQHAQVPAAAARARLQVIAHVPAAAARARLQVIVVAASRTARRQSAIVASCAAACLAE